MFRKINIPMHFLWVVVASMGFGGPAEPLAALLVPVEIKETISITRLKDDTQYVASADPSIMKIPVVHVLAKMVGLVSEDLMEDERIGEFQIGTSASSILKVLGAPQTKSKNVFSEHDARYHQSWHYPNQGITFGMVAESKEDNPKVDSIKVARPSTFATSRGIRIGDSFDKVVKEYGPHQDTENSVPNERFVVGSIYGGLIFSFQNGRVVEIFLGAAAE